MSNALQTLAPPLSLETRLCWLDPPLVQLAQILERVTFALRRDLVYKPHSTDVL